MSSLMTNAASMAALQTLRSINDQMSVTQNRISSGYRVDTASDNAAYWSIATTMRSDNAAMSTVSDALGLGAAQVDVAYTAMESVKDTLDQIKTKLVAASQPGVDKSKIQSEIEQLQNDLKTFASSASFNGSNWLSVDKTSSEKIVASFVRNAGGDISLGTIDVDTSKTALFNADTTAGIEDGLLEKGAALTDASNGTGVSVYAPATAPTVTQGTDADGIPGNADDAAATFSFAAHTNFTLDDNDALTFDISVNGGDTKTIRIDQGTLEAAGVTGGAVTSAADMAKVLTQAFKNAGLGDELSVDGAGPVAVSTTAKGLEAKITVDNFQTSNNGNTFDATTFDITNATTGELDNYMQGIDSMLSKITTAASDLGAIKTRIGSQQDFVGKLMDAVERGVGQLVDADMNEESTRLKALQTQQQLGIQALSIANSNSQNILSLFRS